MFKAGDKVNTWDTRLRKKDQQIKVIGFYRICDGFFRVLTSKAIWI